MEEVVEQIRIKKGNNKGQCWGLRQCIVHTREGAMVGVGVKAIDGVTPEQKAQLQYAQIYERSQWEAIKGQWLEAVLTGVENPWALPKGLDYNDTVVGVATSRIGEWGEKPEGVDEKNSKTLKSVGAENSWPLFKAIKNKLVQDLEPEKEMMSIHTLYDTPVCIESRGKWTTETFKGVKTWGWINLGAALRQIVLDKPLGRKEQFFLDNRVKEMEVFSLSIVEKTSNSSWPELSQVRWGVDTETQSKEVTREPFLLNSAIMRAKTTEYLQLKQWIEHSIAMGLSIKVVGCLRPQVAKKMESGSFVSVVLRQASDLENYDQLVKLHNGKGADLVVRVFDPQDPCVLQKEQKRRQQYLDGLDKGLKFNGLMWRSFMEQEMRDFLFEKEQATFMAQFLKMDYGVWARSKGLIAYKEEALDEAIENWKNVIIGLQEREELQSAVENIKTQGNNAKPKAMKIRL